MPIKNANPKSWGLRASGDGLRWSGWPRGEKVYEPPPINGLIFPSNNVSGSNIGLDWTGSAMLPRIGHTALWKARYVQQSGFYAWQWHVWADDAWHAGMWELGRHPYPATGSVDGTGQSTGGTSSSGTVHWHEQAGLGAKDYLCSPGGAAELVTKGVWYSQAATCELITVETSNDTVRHSYWPDVENDPDFVIQIDVPYAGNYDGTPPTMKERNGCSPWTASGSGAGSTNEECPSGTFRFLKKYSRALTLSEIQAKLAINADETTDPDRWYSNINPTPSDVTDKSGMGHNPSWATPNRPTLYSG